MWRPRDRERYVGTYDPEHEMPDPGRDPGDRWQSDAYRHGARDTRFAYRWNPDRFEDRFGPREDVDREYQTRWRGDARDRERGGYDRDRYAYGSSDFGGGYDRGYGRDYDRDFDRDYDRDYGRGGRYMRGGDFGRGDYGSDRGWDYGRDPMMRGERSPYESDFPRYGRGMDYDRDWRRR